MALRNFFTNIGKAVQDAVGWIGDRFQDSINSVGEWFGGKKYNSTSIADIVAGESELADFKNTIASSAKSTEQKMLSDLLEQFDSFTNEIKKYYPNLVSSIKSEQERIKKDLEGTIMDYVDRHLSGNNPEYVALLTMAPGADKRNAIKEKTNEIICQAQEEFNAKLEKEMLELYDNLGGRLDSELKDKQQKLERESSDLAGLQEDFQKGNMDLSQHEDQLKVLCTVNGCLEAILQNA